MFLSMTGSMMTMYSAVKVVYGGWHLKKARECLHIKTGKNVKYATAPGTPYRKAAISEHVNSEEHKQSVGLELLQRASWLQKGIEKKAEVADEVLVQAFAAFYFIAKEETSNMKVLPLIEFLTRFGLKDM